ncbi:MAG: hypothetical protein Q8M01_12230 [Rubrivivax sp.]|nr:hypothetical protein [Rubrivivax sp.]
MANEDSYRPLSLRRRLFIALLAVATAVTLIMMMLERTGAPPIARPPAAAGPAACTAGQLSGCLGGKADVIFVPAAAAASPASAVPAGAAK